MDSFSASSSLSAMVGSATGNPKNKVALKKGRGLMDWIRLGNSGEDLAGTKGSILQVTPEELAKHNKRTDAWLSLKGKVYNVTAYFEYHPGGEDELMRGVGTDATDLFNEVHKWVNFESLLRNCYVGRMAGYKLLPRNDVFSKTLYVPNAQPSPPNRSNSSAESQTSFKVPVPRLISSSVLPSPNYDWFQTKAMISLVVYTKWPGIPRNHVTILKNNQIIKVVCYIQSNVYTVHLEFFRPVEDEYEVKVKSSSGKVDITFNKQDPTVRWSSLGKCLDGNNELLRASDAEIEYLPCTLLRKETVTHDTRIFVLAFAQNIFLPVPVGCHVFLRIPGSDLVKPYTPVVPRLKCEERNIDEGRLLYLLVKIYPEGHLTVELDKLSENANLEVSLPQGNFNHDLFVKITENTTDLVLIGAGTGITPLVRLLLSSLASEVKDRRIQVLLFNKTEADIPWRKDINSLTEEFPQTFRVTHILSRADSSWSGRRGRIRKGVLDDLLPVGDGERSVFLCACGPTGFTKSAIGLFRELGYQNDEYFAFLG